MALNYQGTFDLGDLFKNSYQQQQSNQIMQQAKLDELLASAAHNATQAANAQKSLPTDLAYKQSMTDVNNANVKTALAKLSDEDWHNAITAGIKTTQALASTAIALGRSGQGGAAAYQTTVDAIQNRLQGMKPESPEYKQTLDSLKQLQGQQQYLSQMSPQDLIKWGTETSQHLMNTDPNIYKEQIKGEFGLKQESMQQAGANWRTKYSVDAMGERAANAASAKGSTPPTSNKRITELTAIIHNPKTAPEARDAAIREREDLKNVIAQQALQANPAGYKEPTDKSASGIATKPSPVEQAKGGSTRKSDEDLIKQYLK